MTATLTSDPDVLTVILEFDLEPEEEEPLRGGIEERLPPIVSGQPGLLAASVHVSRNKRRVLIFLQWESVEAFERFRDDDEAQRRIRPLIGPYGATTRVYDVVLTVVGTNPLPAGGRC